MALASEIVEWFGLAPDWVVAGLALLAILGAGLPTYRKGWIALKNRNLNINALMSIAVTGAVLIGQWPEAAMVSVLFAIAELIEAKSLDRARNAIRGLLQLAPEQATVLVGGEWKELPAKQVELEATVRVKPGERIALDGEVTSGRSSVNQAPITGESLPVEKEVGEPVFAGSINGEGALEYRVTRRADDSTLPGSSTPWRKPKVPAHRPSVSSTVSPASTPRWYSSSPSPPRCCRRCCSAAPGWTGSTAPWCCW